MKGGGTGKEKELIPHFLIHINLQFLAGTLPAPALIPGSEVAEPRGRRLGTTRSFCPRELKHNLAKQQASLERLPEGAVSERTYWQPDKKIQLMGWRSSIKNVMNNSGTGTHAFIHL